MTKKLDKLSERRIRLKEKEFERIAHSGMLFFGKIKKLISSHTKRMINFVFFYTPKDKIDRIGHLVEMSLFYLWVYYTVFKLLGF